MKISFVELANYYSIKIAKWLENTFRRFEPGHGFGAAWHRSGSSSLSKRKKAIRPVPYGYGLRFFKSYQHAALFGVKTAQTAEGMNLDLHIFVRLQDPCLQLPGGRFVLAVTDADLARAESLSGQLGHQCLQGTCLPTALVHGLQGALVAGLAYDADAGNATSFATRGDTRPLLAKVFRDFSINIRPVFLT